MRKQSVLVVLGTRPEAIKLAPVIKALERHPSLQPVVCVTGQHRELLDQALRAFAIRPDFDLDLMRHGQTLDNIAARILLELPAVLEATGPAFVLVQGDTSTCFAAALASFYRQIPVGHVEAGLRTGDRTAPFPEEAHRSMVARLAALHFAPTAGAKRNLLREGVDAATIHVTGNTVIDALQMVGVAAAEPSAFAAEDGGKPALSRRLADPDVPLVLVTGHRRENLGRPLRVASAAVRELARKHPDWCFVYLLHCNPDARLPPVAALGGLDNVYVIEPVDYVRFVRLLARCNAVLTDSGGIQEEATELGKPVLVMRDVTERPEGVRKRAAVLVGTEGPQIVAALEKAVLAPVRPATGRGAGLYGDGNAASRIVEILWVAIQAGLPPAIAAAEMRGASDAPAGVANVASRRPAVLPRPVRTDVATPAGGAG